MISTVYSLLLKNLPPDQRTKAHGWLNRHTRPVWMGSLRRTSPVSPDYGYDRGRPVDRYYIEAFLECFRQDICGHVLEVKDSTYTSQFGTGVLQNHIVDIDPANLNATIISDLADAGSIPDESFDCFILTQTLQLIYDFHSVIRNAFRILRPGGVLLVTVPSASRIVPEWGLESDYWRFTAASCRRMFGEVFYSENVTVHSYGNVLSSIAFLTGMASEELSHFELDTQDPYFPLLIGVRSVRMAER